MSRKGSTAIIIGRLARDPKLFAGDGPKAAQLVIVRTVIERGEEKLDFTDIIVHGKQVDVVMENLKKGSLCCIEGRKEIAGGKLVVVANAVTFLGRKETEHVG